MNWGLVLSGGAACGLANIGVLEALEVENLHPTSIAGSSMGAIVAGLYALGHSSGQIREIAARLSPITVVGLSAMPFKGGLHGGLFSQRLEEHLTDLVGNARIGDCKIPFVCIAGKVLSPIRWERALLPGFTRHVTECVERCVFGPDVRVLDAIRASSAVPVVFSPARIEDDEFVDLVHFGAIPARALREAQSPAIVIATDTQPRWQQLEPWLPASIKEFLAAGENETAQSLAACDLVIKPALPATALRFDQAEAFAESGRRETRRNMAALRRLLTPSPPS